MRAGYVTKRGVVVRSAMVKNMGKSGKGMTMRQAVGDLIRRLNATYVYTRRTSPKSSEIFRRDRDWLREKLHKLN